MKTLGNIIKEARSNKKMSQQQLASKLGVTRQAVSNWENNLSYPDQSLISKISKTLDVELKEIYECKQSNEIYETIRKEKSKNKIYITIILLFLLTLIFYFIINSKKYTTLYLIELEETVYFSIDNTYLISEGNNNYLCLGVITSSIFNVSSSTITLYYLLNNEVNVLYSDTYSENEFIELSGEINNLDNVYLKIEYNYRNNEYTDNIKLVFTEKINKNGLISTETTDEERGLGYTLNAVSLVNNGYTYDAESNCFKKEDIYQYNYCLDNNVLSIDNEEFNIEKDYSNNFVKIYLDQNYVTIYLSDSLVMM